MKVVFSEEANKKNLENIYYLIENWDNRTLRRYINKLSEIINYLEKGILHAQFDEKLGLFKVLIVKQIYLFYEIKPDCILIVTTWNNYKKPFWL
jgi:hypothetical protein